MMVGSGFLPDVYNDELKVLLDQVPPRDHQMIKKIIGINIKIPPIIKITFIFINIIQLSKKKHL